MVNKVIHYCWFGEKPLSEIAIRCIESWKKYCPDYEIKRWDESNFDLECCSYVKEAYKEKKWAFVSDYARFKILYEYGGVYFDTDVELISSIEDILRNGAFMGLEKNKGEYYVNPGLGIASIPGLQIYKDILSNYEQSNFIVEDRIDFTTVVDRVTEILQKHGLQKKNEKQLIAGITIYPSDYFCPLDYETGKLKKTEVTRSIHWYDSSWLDERMKKRHEVSVKIRNTFKGKSGMVLSRMYMSCSYYCEWITTGQFGIIKNKLLARVKR